MTEIFDQMCPMYIVYGMTWEQYWLGDPWIAEAYREAHILRRKMRNEELWLMGLYNQSAVGAVVASAFGKHKVDYVSKPFDIFPKTKIEKKEEERNTKMKLIETLNAWKRSWDSMKKDKK